MISIGGKKAEVSEIFSSIQGEGIYVGIRQIFVRFIGCNLACAYCDEKLKTKSETYTPITLMREIRTLQGCEGRHHSVSYTGGEPLLRTAFLLSHLKLLKGEKLKAYLETNGTLPEEYAKVARLFDIVAMDIKLPSATGEKARWGEHLDFLKIAAKRTVFVKLVMTSSVNWDDIAKAAAIVRKVDHRIPVILQGAIIFGNAHKRNDDIDITRMAKMLVGERLSDVRVIPQMHKLLGVR